VRVGLSRAGNRDRGKAEDVKSIVIKQLSSERFFYFYSVEFSKVWLVNMDQYAGCAAARE
jgi:hypothetical protein